MPNNDINLIGAKEYAIKESIANLSNLKKLKLLLPEYRVF